MKKNLTVIGVLFRKRTNVIVFLISTIILAVVAPYKSYITQWLIDSKSMEMAFQSLALGIFVILLSHLTEYISRQSYTRMATGGIETIRKEIIRKQTNRPMEEYLSENTGSILSSLTNDIRVIYDDYYMALFDMIFWGSMGIVALLMLASIAPVMVLVTVVMCIFPLVVPKMMAKQLTDVRKAYTDDIAEYTGKTGELLKGFETLMASGSTGYFRDAHAKAAKSNREKECLLQLKMNKVAVLSSLAAWVPNIMILITGVILVYNGTITIGYLVTAQSLSNFVLTPCRMVSNAYAKLKASQSVRIKEDALMKEEETSEGTELLSKVGDMQVRNLTFCYPKTDKPALDGICLHLSGGEKMALVGKSGSGKSTITKLVYQYYKEYEGQILVNGQDIRRYKKDSYYQKIAMIPQTPFIFNDTIYNNLCLYQSCSEEEVRRAIRQSGLEDYIAAQPEGWDTMLLENGRNLSGGQAQRISIARAILRKCELLLVDEATSSLDVKTTDEIMNNLLSLDCAMLLITHDIFGEYMKKFDRILYLENGVISEAGEFDQLIKTEGKFNQLYHTGETVI